MVDLNIPVGVSDFEKLRENNYYYIDKTGFISKLNTWHAYAGKFF